MRLGARGCAVAIVVAVGLLPAAAKERDMPANDASARRVDEVRLPGLAIGRSYSTWRLAESPITIRNTSDDTLRIRVDIVLPARHELRRGARAVPDRAWVGLDTREFVLLPHSEHRADVRLTLPYDPDLAGHTYQVDLACAERLPGGWLARQRHRLLFAVEMDYRDDTEIDFAQDCGCADPAL